MNKHFIAAGVVACSLMSPLKASAVTFTGIYAFGDSLTDSGGDSPTGRGNVFNATGGLIPPSPPYSQGRFSNGRIWLDQLASDLKLESPTAITQVTPGNIPQNGINFAFGGATSTGENTISLTFPLPEQLPGLPQEIGAYTQLLTNTQQSADPNALYVLWAGANDYNPTQGSFKPLTSPEQTLGFISNSLRALASVGAKNFLVPNLPDLGITPVARSTGSSNATRLSQLTQAHNTGLSQLIKELNNDPNLDVKITEVDVYSLFSNPTSLGFTNTTEPCLNLGAGSICDNPDEHLFWDEQHPTTTAHQILGNYAYQRLQNSYQSVPEPSLVSAMVALGILSVGSVIQRQQKIARKTASSVSPRQGSLTMVRNSLD